MGTQSNFNFQFYSNLIAIELDKNVKYDGCSAEVNILPDSENVYLENFDCLWIPKTLSLELNSAVNESASISSISVT